VTLTSTWLPLGASGRTPANQRVIEAMLSKRGLFLDSTPPLLAELRDGA
jgi:hypothetical protein